MNASNSRKTAVYEDHLAAGGRMIDFHSWSLPIQYKGVLEEHRSCRSAAALFDVSHMGEIQVEGKDAEKFLNWMVTNDVARLSDGQAQYTVMCHESGGIVDDLLIYRQSQQKYFVVVNGANEEKDFKHFKSFESKFDVQVLNRSHEYTQLAVQGPRSPEIVQKIVKTDLSTLSSFRFIEGEIWNPPNGPSQYCFLARTGYTGEDGFEMYVAWDKGSQLWQQLLRVGEPLGLQPAGLAARDVLRMEMKYPLYGQDLTDSTSPLEAGLGWVVKLKKGEFNGSQTLAQQKEKGLERKWIGFCLRERGIARSGYKVLDPSGEPIGEVTSGGHSPSLGCGIGMAYVLSKWSEVGTALHIEIRGKSIPAEVVQTPFIRK